MIWNDSNYEQLLAKAPVRRFGMPGAIPRASFYGSRRAESMGLLPMEADLTPVPEDQWKDVIEECHREQLFPMYHRAAEPTLEQRPTQGQLNFCWAWSIRAALETCRSLEAQAAVSLAPVTLGWLVNWRNQGFYLEETINAVRERGIASTAFCPNQHDYSGRSLKPGWEQDALNYRTSEWWDTNRQLGQKAMIGQCLAILRTGRPLYWARNVESHATCCVGMWWDESQLWNIVWADFNSWADGVRKIAGNFGMPDEAYGVRSSSFPG